VAESERVAAALAARLCAGSFVALIGPLGAGKSVVARAIGAAWGVTEPMPSPTYTIMAVHYGRLPIYHMDLYRISSVDEFDFAGLRPHFQGNGICLVEWADRIRVAWPERGWVVAIKIGAGDERSIAIRQYGLAQ
jgi:tRNA threonylcarbamoyladenosine biosynthesis protein TsaE